MAVNFNENVITAFRRNKYSDEVFDGFDMNPIKFDVVDKPLTDPEGFVIPDRKGIYRVNEDGTSNYLATVSKNYPIIKHSDIIEKLEDGMKFSNADVKTIISRNGATMQRIYTLKDYSVEVRKQDEISPSIRVVNSYDGSNAIGFFIDAVRLVCTNGMVSIRQFMSMSYRHFGSKFDLNLFSQNANKLISGFNVYARNWSKWTKESVTEERATLLMDYMPVRFRAMVDARMNGNFDNTKWGLYNAYTEALTHDFNPNNGSTSSDTKKIRLGGEITKIFNDNWYWTAPKEEIIIDLTRKRKIKAKDEENELSVYE
jgi:hypothetical protein